MEFYCKKPCYRFQNVLGGEKHNTVGGYRFKDKGTSQKIDEWPLINSLLNATWKALKSIYKDFPVIKHLVVQVFWNQKCCCHLLRFPLIITLLPLLIYLSVQEI